MLRVERPDILLGADIRGAGDRRGIVPSLPIDPRHQGVVQTEGAMTDPDSRSERPDLRHGIDFGKAAEQQCVGNLLAIREVGGEFCVASHCPGQGSRKYRFAVAVVARIGRPTAIGIELCPRARTRQSEILVLGADGKSEPGSGAERVDRKLCVALAKEIVLAVVIGLDMLRAGPDSDLVPRQESVGPQSAGVVGPRTDLGKDYSVPGPGYAHDDVDDAPGGAAAVEHGTATANNFDALDRGERNG